MNATHNYSFDATPNCFLDCIIPNDSAPTEDLVLMYRLNKILGQWGIRRIHNNFECSNRLPADTKNSLDIRSIRFDDGTFVGDNFDN